MSPHRHRLEVGWDPRVLWCLQHPPASAPCPPTPPGLPFCCCTHVPAAAEVTPGCLCGVLGPFTLLLVSEGPTRP